MKLDKTDFKILDGLRGIAAFYVVINHCRGNLLVGGSEYSQSIPIEQWSLWTKLHYGLLQTTALGREFVIFFFVISGFCIAHSLTKGPSPVSFYKRRAIRLYLPYVGALAWAFAIFYLVKDAFNFSGYSVFENINIVIKNLLYIPSGALIPQFWSLSHEVIFYFLAPFLLKKEINRKIYYIASILIYIFTLINNPFSQSGNNILSSFILDYNIYFAVGIFLYYHFDYFLNLKIIKSNKIALFLVCLLFLGMLLTKFKFGDYNKISILLSAILSVLLIVHFLAYKRSLSIFSNIGTMSYSLYITHFASMMLYAFIIHKIGLIDGLQSNIWYIWIIGVLVCCLITVPFYILFEKPTVRWLRSNNGKIKK